ncbi:MAG: hypothetical protein LBH43_06505 [Treponema sp.]|jgi:hypothetical protein|nr:hypothetical protein [Treponema sp.]
MGCRTSLLKEISEIIGISETATKQRLINKGIKPVSYAALYDLDVVDQIKEVPPRGRPKKEAAPEPAKPKAKKPDTAKN